MSTHHKTSVREAHVVVVGSVRAETMLRSIGAGIGASGCALTIHIGKLAELRETVSWRDADLLLAADAACTREDIRAAPRLRAIVTPVLGTDKFDQQAATEAGVLVVNGLVAENYESMAEATIMLALACLYDLPRQQALLKDGAAAHGASPRPRMMKRKTVGIIGFGNIARAVMSRLQGWDVTLLVHSRHTDEARTGATFVGLPELLRRSDVVMVLCSLNEQSRNLLNAETLREVKPGAVLVNTARGGLINEQALVEFAREGRFSCIALDVFEQEPLPRDSALRSLSDAILTPHSIGHTSDSQIAICETAVVNVFEVLRGRAPESVRNPEVIEQWRGRWEGQPLLL